VGAGTPHAPHQSPPASAGDTALQGQPGTRSASSKMGAISCAEHFGSIPRSRSAWISKQRLWQNPRTEHLVEWPPIALTAYRVPTIPLHHAAGGLDMRPLVRVGEELLPLVHDVVSAHLLYGFGQCNVYNGGFVRQRARIKNPPDTPVITYCTWCEPARGGASAILAIVHEY
jgi:hypothetical protein